MDSGAPIVLTDAELAKINARSRKELAQIIVAQVSVGLIIAAIAGLISGQAAALSALAGASAYLVPNLLFAFRLFLSTLQPKSSSPLLFIVGEMLKLGATVAILWMISRVGGDQVNWVAVVIGLIGVLKAYVFVLAFGGFRLSGGAK